MNSASDVRIFLLYTDWLEADILADEPDPAYYEELEQAAARGAFQAELCDRSKADIMAYKTDEDPRTTALLHEYMRYICRERKITLHHGSIEIPACIPRSEETASDSPSGIPGLEVPDGDWDVVFASRLYRFSRSWFLAFRDEKDTQKLWYWAPEDALGQNYKDQGSCTNSSMGKFLNTLRM